MFPFEMMSDIQELFAEKLVAHMLECPDGFLAPVPFIPMMMSGPNGARFSYVFDTERQREIFNKINDRSDGWVDGPLDLRGFTFVKKREEQK